MKRTPIENIPLAAQPATHAPSKRGLTLGQLVEFTHPNGERAIGEIETITFGQSVAVNDECGHTIPDIALNQVSPLSDAYERKLSAIWASIPTVRH